MHELVGDSDIHDSMPELVEHSDDDSILDHLRSSTASSSDGPEWFAHPDQLGATYRMQNAVVGFVHAITVPEHHAPAGLQRALFNLLGELASLDRERAEASEARSVVTVDRMRNPLARNHLILWTGTRPEGDVVMWLQRRDPAPAEMPVAGQAAMPGEIGWAAGATDRMPAMGGGRVIVDWPFRGTGQIRPEP